MAILSWNVRPDPENAIQELKQLRDIGETFTYLGWVCIVTAHCEAMPRLNIVPKLIYEYYDNDGIMYKYYKY